MGPLDPARVVLGMYNPATVVRAFKGIALGLLPLRVYMLLVQKPAVQVFLKDTWAPSDRVLRGRKILRFSEIPAWEFHLFVAGISHYLKPYVSHDNPFHFHHSEIRCLQGRVQSEEETEPAKTLKALSPAALPSKTNEATSNSNKQATPQANKRTRFEGLQLFSHEILRRS